MLMFTEVLALSMYDSGQPTTTPPNIAFVPSLNVRVMYLGYIDIINATITQLDLPQSWHMEQTQLVVIGI